MFFSPLECNAPSLSAQVPPVLRYFAPISARSNLSLKGFLIALDFADFGRQLKDIAQATTRRTRFDIWCAIAKASLVSNRPARTLRDLIESGKTWLETKGVADSARLDTELLIGHAMGLTRIELYMDLDRPVTDEERTKCRALLVRRSSFEPVAYIIGEREFYGHKIKVGPGVLIPRPDTEILVNQALEHIDSLEAARVVDVCTGSGCVALAIARARPELEVIATDISQDALAIASGNLGDEVELLEGDLLGSVTGTVDVVVGNPPYVRRDAELMPDVVDHEPHLALFGDGDGLDHHRTILEQAANLGAKVVLLEIGFDQGEETEAIETEVFGAPRVHLDLGMRPRVGIWTRRGFGAKPLKSPVEQRD